MIRRRFALDFLARVERHGGLPPVVVACSAGVDSVVLLDLVVDLYGRKGGIGNVTAFYADHGQRPSDETEKDRALVADACAAYGARFKTAKLKVARGASEAELRNARYAALTTYARSVGAILLTAHHAQDDLETYLFRLIRGAHPSTIRGIAARARRDEVLILRPLLRVWKEEIVAYARARGLGFREDSTNANRGYARNAIRLDLLPVLESLRPGAGLRLSRFFRHLRCETARGRPRPGDVQSARRALDSDQGLELRSAGSREFHTLKAAVDALLGSHSHRTSHSQWDAVRKQLRARDGKNGGPEKRVQFPGGHALVFRGRLAFWTGPAS